MSTRRLVILDDDPDDLYLLNEIFLEKGFELQTFNDGEQCLAYLNNCKDNELPYAILSDLNMPQISGYDIIKKIKSDKRLMDIEIIICSTSNTPSSIEECLELGAREYFVKPHKISGYYKLADVISNY